MLGKILLSISALGQMMGPFIADFNETHVKNPRWPPHARFHNGQTMSMGVALGLASLYYGFRSTENAKTKKDSLTTAAVFGTIYWITGLSAILYPGSKGTDPEFGEGFPQAYMFTIFGICSVLGSYLEVREVQTKSKTK